MSDQVTELKTLLQEQKALLISVSTGGQRIEHVTQQFLQRRDQIRVLLDGMQLDDPIPFADLWQWYGRWSDGSLKSYQSRRQFVADLIDPFLERIGRRAGPSGVSPASQAVNIPANRAPLVPEVIKVAETPLEPPKLVSVSTDDKPPDTIEGWLMRLIHGKGWFGVLALSLVLVCVVTFAIWSSLPDKNKEQFLNWLLSSMSHSAASDDSPKPASPPLPPLIESEQ